MLSRFWTPILGGCVLIVAVQFLAGRFDAIPPIQSGPEPPEFLPEVEPSRDVLADLEGCLLLLALPPDPAFVPDPAAGPLGRRSYRDRCTPPPGDRDWRIFAEDYGILAVTAVRLLVDDELDAVPDLLAVASPDVVPDDAWRAAFARAADRIGRFRVELVSLYRVLDEIPLPGADGARPGEGSP